MGICRLVVSLLVLGLLAGGLAWLWANPGATLGEAGEYHLLVTGPDGLAIFNGTVFDENGTALSVLGSAATLGDFQTEISGFRGYSSGCEAAYVHSVGGHGAAGAAGWVYATRRDGGAWVYPAQSSACFGLRVGDEVWWRWTDQAVPETG